MVIQKDTGRNSIHHQVQRTVGLKQKKYDSARKNELLYPISPYDEIPAIRDLVKHLSPEPRREPGAQRKRIETRQNRQETFGRNYRHGGLQQRDATDLQFDEPPSSFRLINDAHEVPTMIEVPILPSYSEGSELSLEECLRSNHEECRDPHPFDVYNRNLQPPRSDDRHLRQPSVKLPLELDWPSDEETELPKKTIIMMKTHKNIPKKFNRRNRFQLI